jgi:hypothetical protein
MPATRFASYNIFSTVFREGSAVRPVHFELTRAQIDLVESKPTLTPVHCSSIIITVTIMNCRLDEGAEPQQAACCAGVGQRGRRGLRLDAGAHRQWSPIKMVAKPTHRAEYYDDDDDDQILR